jgi:DNA-binding PadR family transcriptional regulator
MKEILELIAKHNGYWSWYQIDRALSLENSLVIIEGNLMTLLKELEKRNLIFSRERDNSPHPTYWITEEGSIFLEEQKTSTDSLGLYRG